MKKVILFSLVFAMSSAFGQEASKFSTEFRCLKEIREYSKLRVWTPERATGVSDINVKGASEKMAAVEEALPDGKVRLRFFTSDGAYTYDIENPNGKDVEYRFQVHADGQVQYVHYWTHVSKPIQDLRSSAELSTKLKGQVPNENQDTSAEAEQAFRTELEAIVRNVKSSFDDKAKFPKPGHNIHLSGMTIPGPTIPWKPDDEIKALQSCQSLFASDPKYSSLAKATSDELNLFATSRASSTGPGAVSANKPQ